MNHETNNGGVTLSRRTLIIISAAVVLLLVGAMVVGLNWNHWFGADPDDPASYNPDIDPNASEWKGQQPQDKGGAAVGIKIPGYSSITLPKDTETVTVALLNPEGNPCYFTFELVLKDTGETLYKSKLVPPGQAITSITLSRPLSAGEYNATIKISTTSLTDGNAMNGANVETVLIVK